MTTITVSVDATWRLARVEISTPRDMPGGSVVGYTEVMLTEPATPSEGANILRSGLPYADAKTYGVMPGATVARPLDAVLDETVEVEGLTLSMTNVMDALKEFTRRWRVEDASKPPAQLLTIPPPQPPATPMPPDPSSPPTPGAGPPLVRPPEVQPHK